MISFLCQTVKYNWSTTVCVFPWENYLWKLLMHSRTLLKFAGTMWATLFILLWSAMYDSLMSKLTDSYSYVVYRQNEYSVQTKELIDSYQDLAKHFSNYPAMAHLVFNFLDSHNGWLVKWLFFITNWNCSRGCKQKRQQDWEIGGKPAFFHFYLVIYW